MSNPNIPTIKLEPVNGEEGTTKVVATECLGWCYTGQEGERVPSVQLGIAQNYYQNHQRGVGWPPFKEVDLRELSSEEGVAAALAYIARHDLELNLEDIARAQEYFSGNIPKDLEPLLQAVSSGCLYAAGVLSQISSERGYGLMNRKLSYLFVQGGRRAGYDYSHDAASELRKQGRGLEVRDDVETAAELCVGCPHAEQILKALGDYAFESLDLRSGKDIREYSEEEIAAAGERIADLYDQAQRYLKSAMFLYAIREAMQEEAHQEEKQTASKGSRKQITSDKAPTLKRLKKGGKGQKGHD